MKYRIIIILNTILGLVSCTDQVALEFAYYNLANESDCEITIDIYERKSSGWQHLIELKSPNSIWVSDKYKVSPPGGSLQPPSVLLKGDSVIITINDNNILYYNFPSSISDSDTSYNILDLDNYEYYADGNGDRAYIFTFSQDDCNLICSK